ncbi:MAG TPA: transglutaminase-like domain-containing protein, partial [Arachidicoccus sp.]
KGYCAYFAGATLFMLRALHIPSRIATGFLTVDRSSKNPGWYWFYEDQAHAWVQIFFPKYGWIDFDTTIPDMNTQQAPQPDGTPPLGTQKVYFVGDGNIEKIDTVTKSLQLAVNTILYKDKSFSTKNPVSIVTNIAFARFTTDTGMITISDLKRGMHITAASYDQNLDKIDFINTKDTATYVLNKVKKPIAIDEIKVIEQQGANKKNITNFLNIKALNWAKVLMTLLITLIIVIFLTVLSPWLIWQYYKLRTGKNIHHTYRAILYYLNQMGYSRVNQYPQAFAKIIDEKFNTNFSQFNQIYQKEKYSKQPLTKDERSLATSFYLPFIQQIKSQIHWKERSKHFFSLSHTLYFFIKH